MNGSGLWDGDVLSGTSSCNLCHGQVIIRSGARGRTAHSETGGQDLAGVGSTLSRLNGVDQPQRRQAPLLANRLMDGREPGRDPGGSRDIVEPDDRQVGGEGPGPRRGGGPGRRGG